MRLKAQPTGKYYQELTAELTEIVFSKESDKRGAKVIFLNHLRKSLQSFIQARIESNHSSLWTLKEWQKDIDNNIKALQRIIKELEADLYPIIYG